MIDSLEYYHNRDEHGNLRTQEGPEPLDEPFDELEEEPYDIAEDDEDDDDAIDRKYREKED